MPNRDKQILGFARESNIIEGIESREAHEIHAEALEKFIYVEKITTFRLQDFVKQIQPNAFLRTQPNHMVQIAGHVAPAPEIMLSQLDFLLTEINNNEVKPWPAHNRYEYLHPFIDGNGRSGRAVWLWQMINQNDWDFQIPFLHLYYYQTLDNFQHSR